MNELGKMIEELKKKHGTIEKVIEELKKKYGSAEFLTVDEHGRVTDAPLHDPILEAGDPESSLEDTRERAHRRGWSEEMIERHYGKPRAKDTK